MLFTICRQYIPICYECNITNFCLTLVNNIFIILKCRVSVIKGHGFAVRQIRKGVLALNKIEERCHRCS